MKKTVLNVVRHSGNKFRLGVICGEYKKKAHTIILKDFNGIQKTILNPPGCLYKYGSIYSQELNSWLIENGFSREAHQDIWLIKAEFEETVDGVHVFKYIGRSEYVKIPRQRRLRMGKKIIAYRPGELSSIVWGK